MIDEKSRSPAQHSATGVSNAAQREERLQAAVFTAAERPLDLPIGRFCMGVIIVELQTWSSLGWLQPGVVDERQVGGEDAAAGGAA